MADEQMPQPFTTVSPVLVSFDSQDIANGTGYENYFLIESQDSGGKDYHLTPNPDFSNDVDFVVNNGNTTEDHDYDLTPFVFPRTINGTVLISLPFAAAGANPVVIIAELYKWDGSSETQLGSTINYTPSLTTTPRMIYFRMPIANELIPAGETLRFRLSIVNTTSTTVWMGIDPANRTHGNLTITTTSKISIPYKLDV